VLATARRTGLSLPFAALAIALLLPLAVLLGTAFVLGLRFQPLESGSMEPRYPMGSLALVEPIDASDVEAGMAIVFVDPADPSRLVAHRAVKELAGDPPAWQTRGDANPAADALPVTAGAVRGRVAWSIPGLGSVVTAVRGGPAVTLFVVAPLTLLVVTELRDRRRKGRAPAAA
jgi:signal peptidase